MITGYNHNILHNKRTYHIQTEDSGIRYPHVITHLFVGGNIISSKKRSYAELLERDLNEDELENEIRELMKEQHKDMLRELKKGKYDHVDTDAPPPPMQVVGSNIIAQSNESGAPAHSQGFEVEKVETPKVKQPPKPEPVKEEPKIVAPPQPEPPAPVKEDPFPFPPKGPDPSAPIFNLDDLPDEHDTLTEQPAVDISLFPDFNNDEPARPSRATPSSFPNRSYAPRPGDSNRPARPSRPGRPERPGLGTRPDRSARPERPSRGGGERPSFGGSPRPGLGGQGRPSFGSAPRTNPGQAPSAAPRTTPFPASRPPSGGNPFPQRGNPTPPPMHSRRQRPAMSIKRPGTPSSSSLPAAQPQGNAQNSPFAPPGADPRSQVPGRTASRSSFWHPFNKENQSEQQREPGQPPHPKDKLP